MRADVLSKRLFLAGCFGLPWLWCVHVMYWYSKERANKARGEASSAAATAAAANPDQEQEEDNVEGLLSADSEDYPDEPGDPEEISLEEKKWIRRSLLGSVLAGMAWVTWIVVLQVLRDSVNPNWFVRGQDEADFTGW